jgi:predicted CopG family antitoxin
MGKDRKWRFKAIRVGIDIYNRLLQLRAPPPDSFGDVIRRLLDKNTETGWSFVRPVEPDVRAFWESGLFG